MIFMPTFSIESNGLLEKTAVYYNGQQIGGIREIYLFLSEDGTFDSIIQYQGTDKNIHTKNIFLETLSKVKVSEPSFTDEEARELRLLTIESDGNIETTNVYIDDNLEGGIVMLLVHIKAMVGGNGIKSIFSRKPVPELVEFRAEITYRNDDETIETETIF